MGKNAKASAVATEYIQNQLDTTRSDLTMSMADIYCDIHAAKGRFLDERDKEVFKSAEFMGYYMNTIQYGQAYSYIVGQGIFTKIIGSNIPVATVVEQIKPAVDSLIDEINAEYSKIGQ